MERREVKNVRYSRRFVRQLSRLPLRIVREAQTKENIFKKDSCDSRLRTHKLHGRDAGAWAFSVDHSYRVKFIFVGEGEVVFLEVGTHDIYQ